MTRLSRLLLTMVVAIAAPSMALAQTVEPIRDGDRTMGSAEAPVTLTVYLSTTCDHCAHWHTQDFPAFKARFVDTGQVRVAFRDLPTRPQSVAIAGVVMARCAPEERYDAVLDSLFRGQGLLAEPTQAAVTTWLATAGQAGGLTPDQMNACFSNQASFAEVEARAAQSFADGVSGTPAFMINGELVPPGSLAAWDADAFEPLIQPLLDGR
ncbi:MAG: DsbA family protein [Alphaproteobacteria bacterium]|nr:DsbA family protein [Alphaproteobacteria bacterium]MBU2270247.1 DsbA family protein [Alphaproteobacteria bacterium]MBU2417362.1 DsbA family protein [Alphaproteobacteria bacterium]